MTDEFNTELVEKLRARKYREVSEQLEEFEQKRLRAIFPTLNAVRSNIEAGDRKAMLELLTIAADTLCLSDAPPQEARESLADCLKTMWSNLEEAKGFLPRRRGERSARWTREQGDREFFTAMAVENCRRSEGCTLEDAIAKVAEEWGLTDSLVQKRWKRWHNEANKSLELTHAMLQEQGIDMPELLRPERKRTPK